MYSRRMRVKEIRREHYLSKLQQFLDAPVITVVVGLRRVGKSVLLRQFAESIRQERQVVYVDMESLEFDHLSSAQGSGSFCGNCHSTRPAEGGDCR